MGRERQPDKQLKEAIAAVEAAQLTIDALETVAGQLMTHFADYSGEQIQTMIVQALEQYLPYVSGWVDATRQPQKTGTSTNTRSPEPAFHPIAWVGKADLLNCRPDLAPQIRALNDAEVAYIGQKIGDALQETYHLALTTILTAYLAVSHDTTPAPSVPATPLSSESALEAGVPSFKSQRFHTTSIQRGDLQRCEFSDQEIAQLDDRDMQVIATRMGKWYHDESFWHDLTVITRQVLDSKQRQ